MYIPYFRGKQFDLIGLRESVSLELLGSNTIPLIEPVRDAKQLLKTLEMFVEKQREVLVVVNPEVGQVQKGMPRLHDWAAFYESPYVIPVYILNEMLDINELFDVDEIQGEDYVFLSHKYVASSVEEIVKAKTPRYHIISDSARLRKVVKENRVLLTDPFTSESSFSAHSDDCLDYEDEFFCDNHLFFQEDGYIGFSNYGIDGAFYYDKGYPSKVVVLHILYRDKYNSIRIKHFTSDTNDSHHNPNAKFQEALGKLVRWQEYFSKEIPLTTGLRELISYYHTGDYPGPGTIKKLLVMHQLELLGEHFVDRL